MVLEGASRSEAAASNGMDVQTLRDWVLRYNADGVAGLRDRGGQGRRPVLSQEQLAALKAAVIEGPDAARDGVARYAGGGAMTGEGHSMRTAEMTLPSVTAEAKGVPSSSAAVHLQNMRSPTGRLRALIVTRWLASAGTT